MRSEHASAALVGDDKERTPRSECGKPNRTMHIRDLGTRLSHRVRPDMKGCGSCRVLPCVHHGRRRDFIPLTENVGLRCRRRLVPVDRSAPVRELSNESGFFRLSSSRPLFRGQPELNCQFAHMLEPLRHHLFRRPVPRWAGPEVSRTQRRPAGDHRCGAALASLRP